MGNQTSKPRGISGFSRSNTSTSMKSAHSLLSHRSNQSQSGSHKSSLDIIRKSSHANNEDTTDADNINRETDPNPVSLLTNSNPSGVLANVKDLPPSMVQVAPKTPILKPPTSPVHHHHHHHRHHHHSKSSRSKSRHHSSSVTTDNSSIADNNNNDDGNVNNNNSDDEGVAPSSASIATTATESAYSVSSTSAHQKSADEKSIASKSSSISTHRSHKYNKMKDGAWVPKSELSPEEAEELGNTMATSASAAAVVNTTVSNTKLMVADGAKPRIIPKKRKKRHLNIENVIQRLLDAGYSGKRTKSVCLKNSEIAMICSSAREIFLSQPTLLELNAPVKIVGDIHGQYSDLIRIFTKCGFPPSANYLFLGDYVDRGKQSLETILLLFCYKIKYPENFFLLRGNHECAQITRAYGFYDECKRRTNIRTWKLFIDTFNTLPVCALVASKIFCVHGGLSPVLNSIDEIRNIKRPTDVPDFGLLNDLLWSDPADQPNEWEDNERGVSYCFNNVAINKFLNKFQFDLVCRAHMVVEDGYEFFNDRSLVTVFSAPNYCGEFDNWGAVMSVSEELLCSFELLDPLDSVALKRLMKKGRIERRNATLKTAAPTAITTTKTQSY